ncbi:hypothetical protein TKK_0007673 [Trichogramma kaykai]|uniref:Sister chromatid cohesion protein DCC1 n=1 Tax=Trichogramma kaykai TaxID=54128 RepID=A0ABD2X7Z0_9HYME
MESDSETNNGTQDKQEDMSFVKSTAEIEETLRLFRIHTDNVKPLTYALYSTEPLDKPSEQFMILEADDHILKSIEAGECVSFRGELDEPAVLCSGTRSYEVKEAETSSTCLLIPSIDEMEAKAGDLSEKKMESVQILGVYSKYFEIRECSPKLGKLVRVLEPTAFKGLEYENTIEKSALLDWDKVKSIIQASDGEILRHIPDLLVVEMNGYFRLISFEFEARAVPLMLDLLEANSWEIDEVDKEESYDSLKEIIPKPVFECLFAKYASPSDKTKKDGTKLYKYDEEKSTKLLARMLLTGCPSNNLSDFMEAWQIGCPPALKPKEEYLYGVGIILEDDMRRKRVNLFLECDLSDNLSTRLDQLFKAKPKWTVKEITPYLEKFSTSRQDVNAILTKFARQATVNGERFYCSKHGR